MKDTSLHEPNESQSLFPQGRLFTLADLLLGGTCECDACGRWQRVTAMTQSMAQDELRKYGWTFLNGKDLCPKCSGGNRESAAPEKADHVGLEPADMAIISDNVREYSENWKIVEELFSAREALTKAKSDVRAARTRIYDARQRLFDLGMHLTEEDD